ncbi:MAG: hypothetical protein CBB71_14735 [Rhodopirellula sp. TMED11]|nr:MAG: hypothetical protein CBB71_14735 [Rhodopirellula sp. TMED11]
MAAELQELRPETGQPGANGNGGALPSVRLRSDRCFWVVLRDSLAPLCGLTCVELEWLDALQMLLRPIAATEMACSVVDFFKIPSFHQTLWPRNAS